MTIGLDMGGSFLWWAACYATSKNIDGCSKKLVMATAAAPVTVASVGRADRVIRVLRPDFGDRAFAHDLCDFVEQRLAGLRDDVSKNDVCRIESVDDGDRAVPNVSGNIEHQEASRSRLPTFALANSAAQACACVIVSHPGTMLGLALSCSWMALVEQ